MNMILRAAMAGMLLAGGSAVAQTNYPISRCNGENCEIDYGPMGRGTLVGGGRVMVTMVDGMTQHVVHLDSMFSQSPREGYVPLSIGTGENSSVIYVPAAMMEQIRRAMANMPRR
jgi:hypothetical protein